MLNMTLPLMISLLWFISCSEKKSDFKMPAMEVKKIETSAMVDSIPAVADSICGIPSLSYITGKFDPKIMDCFQKIPNGLADKPDLYLRKEVLEAYQMMKEAANKDDIQLVIISATRNFDYQKGIWDRKWTGQTLLEGQTKATDIKDPAARAKAIMKYSAMPGASRHHWGTDIDLNSLNNSWFSKGEGKKLYDWMQTEGKKFGFYQVYTSRDSGRKKGYEEEKWHYTYKPVSKDITKLADQMLTNQAITGFPGSEAATEINVKDNYVMGINPECYE
ncbi:MAG: M15 family metallopeptidase [Saprospiraceae bacterium]|nr:M15 family metallopeptidase [Saprospiraceae bacterium]